MAQRTKMFKQKLPSGKFKDVKIACYAQYVEMQSGLNAAEVIGEKNGQPLLSNQTLQSYLDDMRNGMIDFTEVETW